MGCLLFFLAMIAPRFALFITWIFTPLVNRAFDGFMIPLLGFFFLPFTTLAFSLFYVPRYDGPAGFGWFLVILAFLIDLGAYGRTYGKRRRGY